MRIRVSSMMAIATVIACCVGVAHAQSQEQMQQLAKTTVQFAANNARVASEVCGIDASTVSSYKTGVSKKFAQDADFAKDWELGWKKAAQTVNGLQQMKSSNPQEYDQQKSAICSDMQQQMKS